MKKLLISGIILSLIISFCGCASVSNSNSSSNNTIISTKSSNSTQDIQSTEMNLTQIQAGNYSSLLGTWTEVAYEANRQNGDGEQWAAGASPIADTLSVSSEKIINNDGAMAIRGNTLTDSTGSHSLSFTNSGVSLVASLEDSSVAINWSISFYPEGVANDIQTNNGVKIDNTKNLIVIWTSNNDYTEVFAQTNTSP